MADLSLDRVALKAVIQKTGWDRVAILEVPDANRSGPGAAGLAKIHVLTPRADRSRSPAAR